MHPSFHVHTGVSVEVCSDVNVKNDVCVCVCARVYALRIVSRDKILRFKNTLILLVNYHYSLNVENDANRCLYLCQYGI